MSTATAFELTSARSQSRDAASLLGRARRLHAQAEQVNPSGQRLPAARR